ncbi:MAG TPA: UbiA family prenyltransferase [Vicinamibacterales bacterium]|jgi:4-hydroxybenzoate polyprenyltransferase|nr:UbiA family prenyltransferase [Vicinamibacterales bacterium]
MIADILQTRSRGRAYLLLARVSNLPTVWSNVLAGLVAGSAIGVPGSSFSSATLALLLLSASAFYTGGMFLNDAFDAPFDRRGRPERPLPRGEVGLTEVFTVGGALLVLGLALVSSNRNVLLFGLGLAAAIVFYDARHKGSAVAPLVMGACRGLVYLMAAAAGVVSAAAWVGAGVMLLYVAGLTLVAKGAGANARWLIPALIAGISIVDAVFILVVEPSAAWLAAIAAIGCPLTLSLQRWVPGD